MFGMKYILLGEHFSILWAEHSLFCLCAWSKARDGAGSHKYHWGKERINKLCINSCTP